MYLPFRVLTVTGDWFELRGKTISSLSLSITLSYNVLSLMNVCYQYIEFEFTLWLELTWKPEIYCKKKYVFCETSNLNKRFFNLKTSFFRPFLVSPPTVRDQQWTKVACQCTNLVPLPINRLLPCKFSNLLFPCLIHVSLQQWLAIQLLYQDSR